MSVSKCAVFGTGCWGFRLAVVWLEGALWGGEFGLKVRFGAGRLAWGCALWPAFG